MHPRPNQMYTKALSSTEALGYREKRQRERSRPYLVLGMAVGFSDEMYGD